MLANRKFIPGTEWIYIKVYSGPKLLDELLVNEVHEVISKLYKTDQVDKFFFVRYSDDGGYHLRLRFHFTQSGSIDTLLRIFNEKLLPYIESRMINRITIDTYIRELERYSSKVISEVETVFSVNSSIVINGLQQLANENRTEDRWLLGLTIANNILDEFGYVMEKKVEISEYYYRLYLKEFGIDTAKTAKDQIQLKFRERRSQIESQILSPIETVQGEIFTDIPSYRQSIKTILELVDRNELGQPLDRLVMSFLHMNYNRVFRTKQRLNEMIAHSLASNFYRSYSSRLNKGK